MTVSSTSGPVWRSGVRDAARSQGDALAWSAESTARPFGHVCPWCGALSREALATWFQDGLGPGIVRLYDRSLEEGTPVLPTIGLVFGALALVPLPVLGAPLLLVSLPFFLRIRRQVTECRTLQPKVAAAFAPVHEVMARDLLLRIAIRGALSGAGAGNGGDFTPRLSWCLAVIDELRRESDTLTLFAPRLR